MLIINQVRQDESTSINVDSCMDRFKKHSLELCNMHFQKINNICACHVFATCVFESFATRVYLTYKASKAEAIH